MRNVLSHILRLQHKLSSTQRMAALMSGGTLLAILGWLGLCHPFSSYEMLYPNHTLNEAEKAQVCAYLEAAHIDYRDKGGVLVPTQHMDSLKGDLLRQGIGSQKTDSGKGFELFDTNTWIKGEKELQVLEMRALKGQLERDLIEFENIKHASVILDLAPARSFGHAPSKTKASVILTLMPHAQLSQSQLRAISYHLAGAVRGLEPKMVAISDTKGRLYQAIDAEATFLVSDEEIMMEASLQQKIDTLLEKVLGQDHFHATVQCTRTENGKAQPHIAIVLNKLVLQDTMKEDITRQIQTIACGCGVHVEPVIDALVFETKQKLGQKEKKTSHYLGIISFVVLMAVTIGTCGVTLWWKKQHPKIQEDILHDVMTKVDISKLAHSLTGEDPETLALMLTYLEPRRAEEILASFPSPLQEQVLAELEKVT